MKTVRLALFLALLTGTACVRRTPNTARLAPPQPILQPAAEAHDDDDTEDSTRATEFYLQRRVVPGQTTLPLDRYMAAREHARQMPSVSIPEMARPELAGRSWTSVGPGNVGGRTRSLVINPQNPNIMYAGAVTGGVWKTVDGGVSWTPLTDLLPVLNIGALVMDPNDPNTLYAGTGEWYTGFPGQGIFKTTNAGATWTQLPTTSPQVTFIFEYVNRLVMSPTSPNRLYAATWTGVFTSADGGNTWTPDGLGTSQVYEGCQDLVIRTDQTTDYLYASCTGANSSSTYGIWRNTNASGGGTWTQVFTAQFEARTALALAPSQQSTIYAMAASHNGNPNYENGLLAVYRSTSNGDPNTWTTQVTNNDTDITNTLLLTDSRSVIGNYCNGGLLTYVSGQGNYDNTLAVDPKNPNTVWAGGIDVFRSDDGGVTWGAASLWQLPYTSSQFAHADRHLFVFAPGYDGVANQTMYQATDGGVFRTDNARAAVSTGSKGACQTVFTANTAVQWINLNHSYVATQFYHGFAYPGGQAYMGGTQDNSVSRGTDVGGPNSYLFFSTGDGTSVALDPADSNRFFESKQDLSLNRSVDGLDVLSAISGITETTFPFVPFLAIDPNEGKRLFIGGDTNLWRSVDGANSWTAAAPVEARSSASAIAISPLDSNTVLFGSALGYIYQNSAALASNGTTAWSSARPRSGFVSSLAFDPVNPNVVYAVYSSLKLLSTDAHVYRSTDGGATWYPSDGAGSATLPDIPSFRLIVNPYNDLELFLGTDLGIYVSEDGGNTWAQDSTMADVIVEELALDNPTAANWLFAFTYGRGIYRVPLPGAPNPACTYSVTPTSIFADAFGSVVPVTVTAPAGCLWTALPGTSPVQFHVQSPAQGSGNGTAQVVIEPNTVSTQLSDKLTIANTVVGVTQSSTTLNFGASASPTNPTVLNIPGESAIDTRSLQSNASDPVQSCSGSAGYKGAWWAVTAATSGYLQARAYGRRYDTFGNSGIVITAYAQGALNTELACATIPRDTSYQVDALIQFPVTAGTQYLIEIAATGSTSVDGGYTVLSITSTSLKPETISVSPSTATVTAGSGKTTQFSAQVANVANLGVRWAISPAAGLVSTTGVYTPPESVSAPTTVTVTATSFADSTKQSSATISLVPPGGSLPFVNLAATANDQSLATSQNTWILLKGSNLAPDKRIWGDSDFVNGQMPTQLDGVSVKVNGKPAFVYYISSNQVNVLTPLDATTGTVEVQLTNSAGVAPAVPVHMEAYSPEFFVINGGPYVAAEHLDYSYLGAPSLIPGYTTPAVRGETVVLYANGFGQTNPPVVNPSEFQSGLLPETPVITIGGISAQVIYAAVVTPGLYQFNVTIPNNTPHGDNLVVATYKGFITQSNVLITVQ